MIEIRNLSATYKNLPVLNSISLDVCPNTLMVLLGPNGSGKTTLLKTILGLHEKTNGTISIDGIDVAKMTPREISRKLSYMSQSRNTPNIRARRMVLHGRFPYLSYPRKYRAEDYEYVEASLKQADALEIADSLVTELSGGQRQKIYLAMALAQNTDTILMDEPTSFLDVKHQLDLMELAHSLARCGKSIVVVLHDIRLAMKYADVIAVLDSGTLKAVGTPEHIFQSKVLDKVFEVTIKRYMTSSGWEYYYDNGDIK